MNKKLLDESKAILVEEDVFLDGEESLPEPSSEVKLNAFKGLISDIIKNEFANIEAINGSISTLDGADVPNLEDIRSILGNIADEKQLQIGMLTKALELLDPKDTELMDAGVEKAEDIISEPATQDLNKENQDD